ncbi:MAG: SpvB/TcaC N-terminal domain-containing protein, partial [Candidatus Paceibacterota bacterium]
MKKQTKTFVVILALALLALAPAASAEEQGQAIIFDNAEQMMAFMAENNIVGTIADTAADASASDAESQESMDEESAAVMTEEVPPIAPLDIPNPSSKETKQDLLQLNMQTGAATWAYPISVSPGINGLQPNVALQYNSQATKSRPDISGTAVFLNTPYISRDVNYTRTSTADDFFRISFNGISDKLIYSASENRYHTEHESYLWIEKKNDGINDKGEYWIVKTKDGTIYRFGYNTDSELVSNLESYAVKWSLDLTADSHGNNIYYSYMENPYSGDSGAVYPWKIEYNNDKNRIIEFVFESTARPDIQTTYENGNKLTIARRLKEISVSAGSNLVRKYILEYSVIDYHSFVSGIRECGSDG